MAAVGALFCSCKISALLAVPVNLLLVEIIIALNLDWMYVLRSLSVVADILTKNTINQIKHYNSLFTMNSAAS